MKFQVSAIALGCIALLSGCGGGGGGGSSDGGVTQTIAFDFPGGQPVAVPPAVATKKMSAVASSNLPITYSSDTPDICSVSGDVVSFLKAGECSVRANQAGGNGYAPASQRQLFVIPKQPQMIIFRNPGAQPLDSTPVTLAASSNIPNHPMTFSTTTPTVCTVSGTTMTKVADGICAVTATQAGDDIYATTTVVKNIPIGNATSPALTFLSGYKDASTTTEGGAVIANSAGSADAGWWCEGSDGGTGSTGHCAATAAADGSSLTFGFILTRKQPNTGGSFGGYWNLDILAGGLSALAVGADTPAGVRIDAQAAMKFNLAQNPGWFATSDHKMFAQLILGHHVTLPDGVDDKGNPKFKDCNVTLQAPFTPTAAASTAYSLNLKNDFTISESCGLTGLDMWNELQDYPISKIHFGASTVNSTVPDAGTTATYTTQGTLTGPITFQ
ncbi:hypothetical protein NX784_15575 [Massilia pinisoli]|uniref:Uncharacterized protein n=1 Tax=Massilia pinisoli TaxID=1772194 RepID=A0ABT1ZSV5_9BURK|nr:hypothetical protein [Massilia pinisoli]MCS0583008.1 hypothetical protein [Massilia pinisoli]